MARFNGDVCHSLARILDSIRQPVPCESRFRKAADGDWESSPRPALFFRAYFIKDDKYFELPTPLGYTFTEAEGYVEMWCKGNKLDMLDGIPAKGGKYHKPFEEDAPAFF